MRPFGDTDMKKIFVSRPNKIESHFEEHYGVFENFLKENDFHPQTLGRTAYTLDNPLQAVIDLMAQCNGAIVLGYPQHMMDFQIKKANDLEQKHNMCFPTPWNQIEGVIAFQNKLPLLIIAHIGICGGIFDQGVTGKLVFSTDLGLPNWHEEEKISNVIQLWMKGVN